jgi:Flp pilus assembly protein TadD
MTRFALGVSLLFSLSLFAAEPWEGAPYAGDPRAILAAAEKLRPADAEEGVLVLLDETRVTFDKSGRSTRVEYLIYRVIEESAVDGWSTIETAWSPWYHERPQVDARIIAKDGSVHRLDPKSFGTADASDSPDMFSDTRVLRGPLPAVAPGAVVEQTTTYIDKNPLSSIFGGAGVSQRHQFGRWVESRQSRLVIEWPAELPLKLLNRTKPAIEPKRTEENGITRVVFETGVVPGLESSEWNLPSDQTVRSYVAWSTGQSWQEVAKRYAVIVDEKIGDGAAVERITKAAIGNAKEPREIAARLLAALERDIRYAGVEFGEGSIVPRTPAETLKNKYGDCKDKATLLVAMLRKAGIPAHVALLRSGQGYDVEADLPGFGYFDHVIVVTDGPSPIWIDPTDEFARAGELPDSDQDRLALIAHPETTSLTRTPVSDSKTNRVTEVREFTLSEDGKAAIVETSEYTGSDERGTRRYYTETKPKQITEGIESYAKNVYLASGAPKWKSGDTHDLTKPFQIRIEMNEAGRGVTAGGESAVGVFLSRMVGDLPHDLRTPDNEDATEERKPRTHDYVFGKPYTFEMRYRITPPPGYTLRAPLENETLKLGTATLTKNYTVRDDGVVLADYVFDSGPRRITAAQYEELRTAATKVAGERPLLIYFDSVGKKHLDAGEVGKAVAEYRRLAALHPKEALHHADVARALLAAGMGEAARRAARRAIEVEPKSARGHEILGLALTTDLLGRDFRAGFDHDGAIAAFRKAKELAPEDVGIRGQLAYVLQHNKEGVHYGAGTPFNDAISEYLAIRKEIKEDDRDDNAIDRELMVLYTYAGRWDDLKKLLAETKDTERKHFYQLIAAAATGGTDAALKASATIDPAKRREAQSAAARVLAFLRIYSPAGALLGDAAQGSQQAAQLRQQADLFRKAVRYEDMKIDANDPKGLMQRAFAELVRTGDEETIKPFLTTERREIFETEESLRGRESKEKEPHKEYRQMKRQAGGTEFLADIALANIDVEVTGDDATGYRVRGRTTGESELAVYIVRENGQLRIAGEDDIEPAIALQALRFAEKGNLEAARKWLDWARDHIAPGFTEDPLFAEPFASVWTKGKQGTLEDVRLAAAILLPDTKRSAQIAIPILTAAHPSASPEVQTRIDQALLTAYTLTKQWPELLAAADRLAAQYPESDAAFARGAYALRELKRFDDLHARANARLAKLAENPAALHALADSALEHRRYDEAFALYTRVLQRARPRPLDYNQHAWTAIFVNGDLEKAIENARQATSMSASYPNLNTLAVLYAEQGKSAEARDTLLQSLDANTKEEVTGADWYVVGRIAENYGIRDVALDAYKKIEKKSERGGSVWELAQKRLAKLQ